jgi:hypothetical protein
VLTTAQGIAYLKRFTLLTFICVKGYRNSSLREAEILGAIQNTEKVEQVKRIAVYPGH